MSADVVAPAVLSYIDNGAYPESETVASADLSPSTLQNLSKELQRVQEDVKTEIRSISRTSSTDIDTWITRAKQLQADILHSREVARAIVQESEEAQELKRKEEDKRRQAELLEKEVEFQESVGTRLEHVRFANGVLGRVREALVEGDVGSALKRLEEGEESVEGLGEGEGGVKGVLKRKVEGLRESVKESVGEGWGGCVAVDVEGNRVVIRGELEGLVDAAKRVGFFDSQIVKLGREIDRAIIRPRLQMNRNGKVMHIAVAEDSISCQDLDDDASSSTLFKDLKATIAFLADLLRAAVAVPLSETLIPALTTRLEEEWLEPSVPLELADMQTFQSLLGDVVSFADDLDQLGWHGSKALRDWVQGAPRIWLTKRREVLLSDVRNLVFTGLRDTKVVERVETQFVNNDDALAQGGEEGDDEWDTAWDEPEEELAPEAQQAHTEDDDDASAWDLPEEEEEEAPKEAGADEDEAWGWGDGDEAAPEKPASPKATKKEAPNVNGQGTTKPSQRELTLRETFTVTAIPDSILDLVQQVIADAGMLSTIEYSGTPIAPAAQALYTLPTLALAIYRATAPTAYAKLGTGNMLIYNDASRLSDQLRAWQASQPSASRLRLDNDVKALDQFAKRAYGTEMESQRTVLRDLLDGAQGFSNCTTLPFKKECESAVEQTVDRLREVYKMYQPILSNSALLQSIGSLLATVTGKMITEIEDLPDISEADSQELKELCDRVQTAKDLFQQQAEDGGEARDMTFIYCPNWLKFQYLGELMDSSLADIKYLWNEGELSLEFEAEEVVGLVEALFAESGLRRQAIQEIRRGGRR
ncbi:hypothetical protein M409DRAFT_21084 [Zasmidium cellare ATCC 36951]|uniref:ZW10 C-terminal helical domain-containing protein n=1 Tax=Zasmidium cellare ATCC 36951 TaxID=1080233 RepID=A0A6A6CQV8_ZASCE|nr:uncharacterized protein M409DRAFT_21084 [Zasmidium cellare ATCC 36951]KAF2169073.1 hypothetical protein M409DRAFT_21084 [Zasmidium cellare ATCC 36951]